MDELRDQVPEDDAGARRRLEDAALKLFNRKGYAATSVREIVAEAGFTKPVLYYHFGSKEGIYVALLEDALAELRRRVAEAIGSEGSCLSRVVALSRTLFIAARENVEVVRLLYATYYGPPQGAPDFDFDTIHHAFFDPLAGLVSEGMDNGELQADDPETVALALHGAVTTVLEGSLAHPEEGYDEDLVEKLLNLMFDGIAVRIREE